MSVRVLAVVLVGASFCLAAAPVRAQQPTVVVLDFAGKGGDKARIQVIRALRDRATFETKSSANQVLSRKGLSAKTVAGRAAVADELGLDYVIWGSVRGKGSAARAKIRFAGPKGREIAAREAGPPGSSKGNARIQKATLTLLQKSLAAAPPRSSRDKRADAKKTVPPASVVAPSTASAKPAPVTIEEDEPIAIQVKARTNATTPAPYLMLLAGAGGRVRNLEINVDDGAGDTGTRTYESGIYLDIVFRLEVRPLAQHRIKGVRGFALEADADFGVGLSTQPPGSTTTLDTKAWRVLGQLGYFHRFDKGELGGLIGIGFDRLQLQTNGTIPSVDYLYLRLGPAYRHFFIERLLYLRVDGGFRYPFSYGSLEDSFGSASGFGFDAALSLGGELDVGFTYAARLAFDYFKPQFSGFPAGMVPPLPGAASGRDATDLAINFHVIIGWSF
jgi:hypothetical protein